MEPCKSPTHKAYRDSLETADIQAYIIELDLAKARQQAKEGKVVNWARVFEDAAERGAFAVGVLVEAEAGVNRHFDRGCRNLADIS